jgi:glycerol uptake facilitator-like aquaporin
MAKESAQQTYSLGQKLSAEFFGTLVFFYVIQSTSHDLHVPIGLFFGLCFFGKISGGHLNPAVTLMMIINGSVSLCEGILYMFA